MDLSVAIVNFNTKDLLRRCLLSVFSSKTKFAFEVWVSDNGSTDASIEMVEKNFPKVRLLENGVNLGFSKANNLALRSALASTFAQAAADRQALPKFFLLLNSDTEVRPDTFELSLSYMNAHPEVGILGCKVMLPDGSLDPACRRRFPNPANAFLRLFGFARFSDYNIGGDVNLEQEVDAVMGAYLLIRREVMEKIGLLDEEYFMYGEDLDWCWRAKQNGFKVIYFPGASIVHYKYGSSQKSSSATIRHAHEAMKIFYRKHYASQYPLIFNRLVYLGISLRQGVVLIVNFFRSKKRVH